MNGSTIIRQAQAGLVFAMASGWTTGAPAGLGRYTYSALQDDGRRPSSSDLAKTVLSELRVQTIVMAARYGDVAEEWRRIVNQPAERVDDVLLNGLPRPPEPEPSRG